MLPNLPPPSFGLPLTASVTGTASPSGLNPAPASPASNPVDTVVTGVLPDGVSPSAAMEILQKARSTPELQSIGQSLAAAQARLAQAEGTTVDHKVYTGKAMSSYGIWALCMPPLGAMLLLPHMGLTGMGALAGMVGGMFVAPALAIWAVQRSGESDARAQEAVVEQQKGQCRNEVSRLEQSADSALRASMLRLWKEQQSQKAANASDPNGRVTATETEVKIGNVVVSRRLGDGSSAPSAP